MPRDTRERARYGFLMLATVGLLAVQGTVDPGAVQQVVVTALAGASLLLAFRAAALAAARVVRGGRGCRRPRRQHRARDGRRDRGRGGPDHERGTRRAGPARDRRGPRARPARHGRGADQSLFGVLSLYMLIGMAFGFVYGAIDRLGGDPFFAGGNTATVAHCIYFSFTTLATVGYGDFVARTNLGHTLAVSEALIGQIYLVTIVSLIVTNLRRPLRDDVST